MSSSKAHKLSSEEALTEYFTALLNEETEVEEVSASTVSTQNEESLATSESGPSQVLHLTPKRQPEYQTSYTERKYSTFDVPDLDDVQKLLDKISTTDFAAEPEIVSLIEQNTVNITQIASQPDLKTEVHEGTQLDSQVDEIQDWEIETADEIAVEAPTVDQVTATEEVVVDTQHHAEQEVEKQALISKDWTSTRRDRDFQVLYFDVNGVTFAVPLDELGGIHRITEVSHLIGRPGWYFGLQTNKDSQYDVVDTAKWVMADRLKDSEYKDAYQYIVMLGESSWGLAATQLKGTELLSIDSVRWREQAGKRPWLAGMVKEKMCALIHVEAMIMMIKAGLDVRSLDK